MRSDPGSYILNNTSGSLITLAILSLTLIPFQAGFEEILFRGYLIQGFAYLSRNRWLPIVATSVLFGLMHALNPEVKEYGFFIMIPQYIIFVLIMAIVYKWKNIRKLYTRIHVPQEKEPVADQIP